MSVRIQTYLIAIILVLGLNSCQKHQLNDCFTSAGSQDEEVRILDQFDRIQIGQKFDVVLVQDTISEPKIIIKAGKNVIEGIEAEVENNMLRVRNRNTCNFVRSFKDRIALEIHFSDLKELIVSGDVFVENRDTLALTELAIVQSALNDMILNLNVSERIHVSSINSSAVLLHGRAKKLEGSIEEVSNLDARNLKCEEVLLDVHTPWDCYIDGRKIIFVKIFNSGNIYYREEPLIQKELNVRKGSGDLLLFE